VILLATHYVTLCDPAAGRDSHGWALADPPAPAAWSGWGSLQMPPATANRAAAESGGRGPNEPATAPTARLFLPLSAPLRSGQSAFVTARAGRGMITPSPERWTVGAVWDVPDPTGGNLGARVAECVRVGG
jgi:hypothetical protein